MAAIEYPVERMQAAAAQIRQAARTMQDQVTANVNAARGSLQGLQATNLQSAYGEYLRTWEGQVNALVETWLNLAQNLMEAAEQMQTADQSIGEAAVANP